MIFHTNAALARYEIAFERGEQVPAWAARAIALGYSPRRQARSVRAKSRARVVAFGKPSPNLTPEVKRQVERFK